jgi:hypothetical protein
MKVFRIKFDYAKSQPSAKQCAAAGFGERNDGLLVLAETQKQAVEDFNAQRLPGDQLNPRNRRLPLACRAWPRRTSRRRGSHDRQALRPSEPRHVGPVVRRVRRVRHGSGPRAGCSLCRHSRPPIQGLLLRALQGPCKRNG